MLLFGIMTLPFNLNSLKESKSGGRFNLVPLFLVATHLLASGGFYRIKDDFFL